MHLTYRGQAYAASMPAIDGTPTGEIAIFRGRSYRMKQFNTANRHQPGDKLTYRGVRYSR